MEIVVLGATLCLLSSTASAAVSAEALYGTYRFVTSGSSFWKYTGGEGTSIYDILSADVGSLTFNIKGTCSVSWDENEFEVGLTCND